MSEFDALVMPSKPPSDGASGGVSQKDRRFPDTFFDLHKHPVRFPLGRPWTGERELSANNDRRDNEPGFVTSDLQQGEHVTNEQGIVDRAATFRSVWTAPWTPLAKYFIYNYKRKTIRFDYQRMRMEEQQSYDRYFEAAAILGAELNREIEYGVIPHFQITAKIGYPTRMVKIAEAAIAGDPWLLGFTDSPNVELAKLLNKKVSQVRHTTERNALVSDVAPPPAGIVTPEQVLATPQPELMKMLAEMTSLAVEQALQRRDQEAAKKKAADKERMASVRAKRRVNTPAAGAISA